MLLELSWHRVHEMENCSGLLFPYNQPHYAVILHSSIFSLIQFPNSECTDSNGDCGTCLTGVSDLLIDNAFIETSLLCEKLKHIFYLKERKKTTFKQ